MEGIIELIMGTDYPDLGNLLPKLDKLTEMGNLLINNLPKNEDPLNILPTTHSIGYLYILSVLSLTLARTHSQFHPQTRSIISSST